MEIGVRTAGGRIETVRDWAVFSTLVDGQRTALFELFRRRGPRSRWMALGRFELEPLSPAPAGKPDLLVAIRRSRGRMFLEVKASVTGRVQTVPLGSTGLRPRLAAAACALALITAAAGLTLRGAGRERGARDLPQLPAAAPQGFGGRASASAARSAASEAEQERGPAAEPTVAAPPESEYRVMWGDTLWRITERFYGDRSLYDELAVHNGLADADFIIAGETLRIPPALLPSAR